MEDLTYADREAELALLAVCLRSSRARDTAKRTILGADFYDPRHETIWDSMNRLERHGKSVDAVTVLAALGRDKAAELMVDLVTNQALADSADTYAEIVHSWGLKRRLNTLAIEVQQHALNPNVNVVGYAATAATKFANLRDAGLPDTETAETLAELLSEEDDEPDWLIPGLLERRDRFMLTGMEGLGKSHVMRQIAVLAAAGLDPFKQTRIKPLRVTIIDCENSRSQVRRKMRPMTAYAQRYGLDPTERVIIDCTARMDLARDKDLARIHQLLDATSPDLVVIGPLYRLVPRAMQTDDEAAPVLAALDTIRERDVALLIEAHAGHAIGKGGMRDLRPRGSSALMGWPEFGYGLAKVADGYADLVPWRGDRDQRNWPNRIRHARDSPLWIPVDAVDVTGVA